MRISHIEIQNFRKLKSVRVDFADRTTILVGANNSGKTSAMLALGHFLVNPNRFTPNDFTLSNWAPLDAIGTTWEKDASTDQPTGPDAASWETIVPSLDIWLEAGNNELHYVRALLPTLDWAGGLLGVRLRYEPDSLDDLYKEYVAAIRAAREMRQAASKKAAKAKEYSLKLWPECMRDFLERRLRDNFTVKAYLLDAAKSKPPVAGIAKPQPLPDGSLPLDVDPFHGLIQIDEIEAQRGLGDSSDGHADAESADKRSPRQPRKLTEQLRSYYTRHLDPSDSPEPADLDALEAIEKAQQLFDGRLETGFAAALTELASLNYPGITDPKLTIATKMRPTDGLRHSAAVQYEVLSADGKVIKAPLRLPEDFNGLGYQNLISMVFKLMSYRDRWMRVGKAAKPEQPGTKALPYPAPLHLVLVEEPEAHLHAQVQQVFVRKAYEVLRNHEQLKDGTALTTQLVVSTHSSHIAHEVKFSCLRYFLRLPGRAKGDIPTSAVVNLSEVFGPNDETDRFVTRYLKATHCDLFFADAAILVEGPAERMLVPHFIKRHFPDLARCYVTLLEIGGSHAHRLKPLIEHLGLTTLVITDLDSSDPAQNGSAVAPKRGGGHVTSNPTLEQWHPKNTAIDQLLDLNAEAKLLNYSEPHFTICVSYQTPIALPHASNGQPTEALASTFEDSLVFENLELFRTVAGTGLVGRFRRAVNETNDPYELGQKFFEALRDGDKAAFALDMLSLPDEPMKLNVPKYIAEGLGWLQSQVTRQISEVLAPTVVSEPTGNPSCPNK